MRRSSSPLERRSAECWSTHQAQPFSCEARSLTRSCSRRRGRRSRRGRRWRGRPHAAVLDIGDSLWLHDLKLRENVYQWEEANSHPKIGPLRARRCSSRSRGRRAPRCRRGRPAGRDPERPARARCAPALDRARSPTDLGLARGTVAEAYAQLQAEGYPGSARGGTWVSDVAAAAARMRPHQPQRGRASASTPAFPDLTAFPQGAWMSALRRAAGRRRQASATAIRAAGRAAVGARRLPRPRARRGRRPRPDRRLRRLPARPVLARAVLRSAAPAASRWRSPASTITISSCRGGAATSPRRSTSAARAPTCSGTGPRGLSARRTSPSGALLQPERRAAARGGARARRPLVIEDDYDAELRFDRPPVGSLQALDPEHVVYAGRPARRLRPDCGSAGSSCPPALADAVLEPPAAEDLHARRRTRSRSRSCSNRARTSGTSDGCGRATAGAATGS